MEEYHYTARIKDLSPGAKPDEGFFKVKMFPGFQYQDEGIENVPPLVEMKVGLMVEDLLKDGSLDGRTLEISVRNFE
jgi:hypothetical protein